MTDLSTHPLRHKKEFTGFTDQEFQSLIEYTRFRKYGKGQILFYEEDPKQTLFYLESGLVRLERYDISGDFLYVDYVKKGRLFPYGEIFSGDMYHYTASALTNVELYALP
ncbi:Crp/Fnr family transcriptional regulator, partial [Atopococcus tabaci]